MSTTWPKRLGLIFSPLRDFSNISSQRSLTLKETISFKFAFFSLSLQISLFYSVSSLTPIKSAPYQNLFQIHPHYAFLHFPTFSFFIPFSLSLFHLHHICFSGYSLFLSLIITQSELSFYIHLLGGKKIYQKINNNNDP